MTASTKRSPLAFVVLALLGEAPMHAYRIQQLITKRGKEKVVNIAQRNSIHQTLDRLLRGELIRVRDVSRTTGRPQRTIYEITPDGADIMHRWLRDMLASPAREFPEFPAALAFAPWLSPTEVARVLRRRVETLRERLEGQDDADLPRVLLLEEEYVGAITRAEIQWTRAIIDEIEDGTLTWDTEGLLRQARREHEQAD